MTFASEEAALLGEAADAHEAAQIIGIMCLLVIWVLARFKPVLIDGSERTKQESFQGREVRGILLSVHHGVSRCFPD
jgi:hypothetical protein